MRLAGLRSKRSHIAYGILMAWRIWGRVIFLRLTHAPGGAHTFASWTVGASGSERARRVRERPRRRLATRARTGARTAPRKASSKSRTPCRTGTTVVLQGSALSMSAEALWRRLVLVGALEWSSNRAEVPFLTSTGRKMATNHTGAGERQRRSRVS